jgi:uncharacterized membrane protein YdjX (TVP38/TMEM64 family)
LKKRRHPVWFWLAVGTAALLVALFLYSPTFKHWVDAAMNWAEQVMDEHPLVGAAVFFVFSAISAMLAFASSVVLVPPANVAWGKQVTFLLLWGGWLTGSIVSYGIGRLARPLLNRLSYEKKLNEYQQFVSRRMKFWAVLLFCIAIPSEIPGYLFGGMRYSFAKFTAAIGTAEVFYAIGVVYAGERLLAARPHAAFVTLGILGIVALGAGLLIRVLKRRRIGGMSSS